MLNPPIAAQLFYSQLAIQSEFNVCRTQLACDLHASPNCVIFGLVVCHYAEAQGGAGCYFTMCVQDNNASCRWSWVAPASSVAMNDELDGQPHLLNRVQPPDGTGWTAEIAR